MKDMFNYFRIDYKKKPCKPLSTSNFEAVNTKKLENVISTSFTGDTEIKKLEVDDRCHVCSMVLEIIGKQAKPGMSHQEWFVVVMKSYTTCFTMMRTDI